MHKQQLHLCYRQTPRRFSLDQTRQAGVTLLLATAMIFSFVGPALAKDIDLDTLPPFLLQGVPPNLVMTLDDSGSMEAGFLPSSLIRIWDKARTAEPDPHQSAAAVLTSPDVNRIYYNPTTIYLPGADKNGESLGHADFSAAKIYAHLEDCGNGTTDLGTDYIKAFGTDYTFYCTGELGQTDPPSAAYYHLYDPGNLYNTNPDSNVVCNAGGSLDPVCNLCGDDFSGPNEDTPDACFDRVLVGGSADLLIAECSSVPEGTSGIAAQDTFEQTQTYNISTSLSLVDRIENQPCVPRGDTSALNLAPGSNVSETNFANWYSYHRTRMLMVKTSLSHVMHRLPSDIRMAYQQLRQDDMWESNTGAFAELANTFGVYSDIKSDFYAWISRLQREGANTLLCTSHVRAAEFMASDLAQADDINAHRNAEKSFADNSCAVKCRNNFHLMFTDGGWEDYWGNDMLGQYGFKESWPCEGGEQGCWMKIDPNQDGASVHELPYNRYRIDTYDPNAVTSRIYADGNTGMLADIVFYYWRRDLRPDASNLVPPLLASWDDDSDADSLANFWNPTNDPATWQHVSFYAVGLGANGAVTPSDLSPYGTYSLNGSVKTLLDHGFPSPTGDMSTTPYTDEGDPGLIQPAGPFTSIGGMDLEAFYEWLAAYMEALKAETVLPQFSWNSGKIPEYAKIDDLYHAVLNGRGSYFNASNTDELISSLTAALHEVASAADATASNASVDTNVGWLGDGTLLFQTIVNTADWSGQLRVYRISTGSGEGFCNDQPRGEPCLTDWVPSEPTASNRNIFTPTNNGIAEFERDVFDSLSRDQQRGLLGCGDNSESGGLDICNDNADPTTEDAQNQILLAKDRIEYLRGGMQGDERFRPREFDGLWLGDIIGSNPATVGSPTGVFPEEDYITFRNTTSRPDMIYVGSNDGMLHAFLVPDSPEQNPNGREEFAYVPKSIYAHLSDLTEPDYASLTVAKRAFVDGPITIADAKFTDKQLVSGWKTVLVGSFGRGAQGIYALNITHPDRILANPENLSPWEFNDASGSDADGEFDGRDMGYSLGQPVVVRIDDDGDSSTEPTWVVLVSNGFNNSNEMGENSDACRDNDADTNCTISQTGNAVLYVLKLGGDDEGRILAKLDTERGFCQDPRVVGSTPPRGHDCEDAARGRTNALAPVRAMDVDGDLTADLAYAGDLFGNLWRFDLTNLSNSPVLIFSATGSDGYAQPITASVAAKRHPTGIGTMVLFGTGQYLNSADKTDFNPQTFYGIWDDFNLIFSADGDQSSSNPPSRDDLLAQEFVGSEVEVVDADGVLVSLGRVSTDYSIDWSDNLYRGWYIDLVPGEADPEGERVIVAPEVRNNRIIFASMIPEGCCLAGGSSWANALDANDGSRIGMSPFDYDLNGTFNSNDLLGNLPGSSIRNMTDGGTGIYSAPTRLGLGGGQMQSIVSDSEGDIVQLQESTGLIWRNWTQLR